MNATSAAVVNPSGSEAVADAAVAQRSLLSNDFVLFGLPERFAQERSELDARWKELQKQAHPDRFAADVASAQRLAMQWSVRINEAYQRLRDPLRRWRRATPCSGPPPTGPGPAV